MIDIFIIFKRCARNLFDFLRVRARSFLQWIAVSLEVLGYDTFVGNVQQRSFFIF